jgi:hypothetical protein
MKNRIVSVGLLTCVFLFQADLIRAQAPARPSTPEAPILPMDVKFRYVPQYFEQSFGDDPRYSRIEALVAEGRCDVVLLDKTMNREAFYSTLNRKVDALAANGADAYTTPIDFAAFSTDDSHPLFRIHFRDHFGQEITWQFVVGQMVPHASPEVISRTDNSGVVLFYAAQRAAAIAGTTLTIAGRKYLPEASQSNDTLSAFYATDMTVGQILPGTDLWRVDSSPTDIEQTAKWNLSGDGGRQRILAVKQLYETEASVDQIDLSDPDAPQVVLNVVRVNNTYGLRSLSFKTHGNTLWIFFGPALPLPAHQIDDRTTVTFTVAENEQASVASGKLEVQRVFDAEHLSWHFDTPNLARGDTFETGVNLIPSDSEQAKCANEDCSARSQKRQ